MNKLMMMPWGEKFCIRVFPLALIVFMQIRSLKMGAHESCQTSILPKGCAE